MANTIKARPAEIGHRSSFGHWEGDLLAFRQEFGKANLTSLVERCSRFTILARNPSPPFGRCHGWHRQAVENLEIGRAHVCTPVTNAHLVCRLLPEKKTQHKNSTQQS